jgi:hypothetical protein
MTIRELRTVGGNVSKFGGVGTCGSFFLDLTIIKNFKVIFYGLKLYEVY